MGFLRLLLIIVFVAMGVLHLLLVVFNYLVDFSFENALLILIGLSYIMAAYGLSVRAKWGWVFSVLLVLLNIMSAYVLKHIITLLFFTIVLILLLVVSREYKIPSPISKTTSKIIVYENKRFIREKSP